MLASVIVPTTCELKRAQVLRRCIESVVHQTVAIELLLVVNGDDVDEALFNELQACPGARVIRLAEGNVSQARLAGLMQSRGDYFCFLDDDDELLPNSLQARLQAFEVGVDVVVANGIFCGEGPDRVMVSPHQVGAIQRDPMAAFLRANWFASPAALFRRGSVDDSLFDMRHRYFEWTLLFFHLFRVGARFRFLDEVTYRIHSETQASASKSAAYAKAYPEVLQELWSSKAVMKTLDAGHRRRLRAKLAAAYNGLALSELKAGRLAPAWRAHLRSLGYAGFSYFAFTRKLIFRGRVATADTPSA